MQTLKIKFFQNNFFITSLNSTVSFVLAYIFVYFIYQLSTVLMAADFEIETILYYNTIRFITPDFSSLWSTDSALVVFGAGPLISIVLGIIFIFLFHEVADNPGTLKVFLLWVSVHFFTRTFSSFTIGTIFFLYGSNLIADWLFFSWGAKMMLSILAVVAIIVIGIFYSNNFIKSTSSLHLVKTGNRDFFTICHVVIPWFAGSIIIIIFQLPGIILHEIMILGSYIFIVVPVLLRNQLFVLYGQEAEIPDVQLRISWPIIIALFITALVFRFGLNNGIYFG